MGRLHRAARTWAKFAGWGPFATLFRLDNTHPYTALRYGRFSYTILLLDAHDTVENCNFHVRGTVVATFPWLSKKTKHSPSEHWVCAGRPDGFSNLLTFSLLSCSLALWVQFSLLSCSLGDRPDTQHQAAGPGDDDSFFWSFSCCCCCDVESGRELPWERERESGVRVALAPTHTFGFRKFARRHFSFPARQGAHTGRARWKMLGAFFSGERTAAPDGLLRQQCGGSRWKLTTGRLFSVGENGVPMCSATFLPDTRTVDSHCARG